MYICVMLVRGQSDEAACDKLTEKNSHDSLTIILSLLSATIPGLNRKAVTRINSMPSIGSRARQARENQEQPAIQSQSLTPSHVPLEVGSMVEVVSNSGITVYGVVRWLGVLPGKTEELAGIELVRRYKVVRTIVGFKYLRKLVSDLIFIVSGL